MRTFLDYLAAEDLYRKGSRQFWKTVENFYRKKKEIIGEIRSIYDGAGDLSFSTTNREYASLLRNARYYFGSWDNAVQSAGINYTSVGHH